MKSRTNAKTMYINKDEDFFVQLRDDGYYLKHKNDEVYVEVFEYRIIGKIKKESKSGILLTEWRIEHQ